MIYIGDDPRSKCSENFLLMSEWKCTGRILYSLRRYITTEITTTTTIASWSVYRQAAVCCRRFLRHREYRETLSGVSTHAGQCTRLSEAAGNFPRHLQIEKWRIWHDIEGQLYASSLNGVYFIKITTENGLFRAPWRWIQYVRVKGDCEQA